MRPYTRQFKRHGALPAALIIVLALLAPLMGCDQEEAPAAVMVEESLVNVMIEVVEPGEVRDILVLPGETEPADSVTVSAEYAGKVEWVGPEEGDLVEVNEEIAMIDITILEAQLNQAQANYSLASDLAQRRRELRSQGVVSQEDLDQAERDRIVALNQLEEAKLLYNQSKVTSPIAGVVNKVYVEPGEFASRGDAVADIVNPDRIRITVSVPEMDIRWLETGDPSLITIDAYPDEQWVGSIEFVSFQADSATKTFDVWVEVDNTDGRIRPGMMARTYFEQRVIEDAVSVPLFSVVDRGGERIIFVEQDGVARARQPEFGVIEGDRVQVLSGLEPGENLIIKGQTTVEEGVRVVVR